MSPNQGDTETERHQHKRDVRLWSEEVEHQSGRAEKWTVIAKDKVIRAYLEAYRKLVVSEQVKDKNASPSTALSILLRISCNHRVEVTVTEFSPGKYILSDMARTLGELAEGGKTITSDFRKRAEEIAAQFGTEFVLDHLICQSDATALGGSIQRFAEACKTIGDVYLLQRSHYVHVRSVVDEVKRIFKARQIEFKQDFKVPESLRSTTSMCTSHLTANLE